MRESLGINIENSIVVVDEAHNIEDTCREAGSIDMSVSNFIEIMRDLCILHAHFDNRGLALETQGATHLMLFFQNALQWLMVKASKFQQSKEAKEEVARLQRNANKSDAFGGWYVVFMIHVGGTRCVTSSTDNILKIQARITWNVECIRGYIFTFLFDV